MAIQLLPHFGSSGYPPFFLLPVIPGYNYIIVRERLSQGPRASSSLFLASGSPLYPADTNPSLQALSGDPSGPVSASGHQLL